VPRGPFPLCEADVSVKCRIISDDDPERLHGLRADSFFSGGDLHVNDRVGFWRFGQEDVASVRRSTFVRWVEHHATVASTNTRALAVAADNSWHVPALIVADEQTEGRGRGANRWWSAPGCLTCSLVLGTDGEEASINGTRVSLTAGLAVSAALQQLCPALPVGLKWPNDVFIRARKVCGILVEVPPRVVGRVVVGIGVNVNNPMADSGLASATSLVDEVGYRFELTRVLIAILRQLEDHLKLLAPQEERLASCWRAYCMLTGNTVRVQAGSNHTVGVCRGIDANGALLVETSRGVQQCLTGAVSIVS